MGAPAQGGPRAAARTSLGYERAQAKMDLERAQRRLLDALTHVRAGEYAWAHDAIGEASNAVGSGRYHLREALERVR